jgi:membrane-associated phospholipid phosphatase
LTTVPLSVPRDARAHPLHPAELATLAILAVVTVTLAAAVARGVELGGALLMHAALLAGFAVVAWALARRPGWAWGPHVRGVAVIATMFVLYSTLGHVAFEAIPWIADPALDAADRALLLGRSPSLVFAADPAPRTVELLSFFYAAFIPYLYMSILLGLAGRPADERDEFVTAFAVLYALSFLGYLFLPARGPIVQMAGEFPAQLQGGFFHRTVVASIDSLGGPHGAFPSLHVGASFLAAWFDLRHRNLLRGLIYVPLVALIAVATIVLRYHWVVDLVAGVGLALLAHRLAPRLLARWRRAGGVEAP